MSDSDLQQAEALLDKGDRLSARSVIGKVLEAQPDDVHALHLMSSIDMDEGNHVSARVKIERLLKLDQAHAPATYNLGVCIMQQGDTAAALEVFRKALQIDAKHSGALYNTGYILRLQGRLNEATAQFERLVKSNPNWLSAWEAFVETLLEGNRYDDALAACDVLVRQGKTNAKLYRLRGHAYRGLGDVSQAESSYILSHRADEADADTLFSLAEMFRIQGRFGEAIPAYERVLVLAAKNPAIIDRFDPALSELILTCRAACHWKALGVYEEQAIKRASDENGAIGPNVLLMLTDNLAAAQTSARNVWPKGEFSPRASVHGSAMASAKSTKLRIGIISDDFSDSANGVLLSDIVTGHSGERLEYYAFNSGPIGSARREIKQACRSFRNTLSSNDEQLADAVMNDELDLLVSVMGIGGRSRLNFLRYRPAPIIANYLAFPATMGTKLVDYLIADGTVVKNDELRFYDEAVVRLPRAYRTINAFAQGEQKAGTRGDYGLDPKGFVFGVFGATNAINSRLFDTYLQILKDVPGSQLWLSEEQFSIRSTMRTYAVARGVDAERLVFAARVANEEHLERLKLVDLALDTFPLCSEGPIHNSLIAGVPVLTRKGGNFVSRIGATLAQAAGLPELVATSEVAFHDTAVRLAQQPAELAALRKRLQDGAKSALFDTNNLRIYLERAFEMMIERHRQGLAPESFSVPALN